MYIIMSYGHHRPDSPPSPGRSSGPKRLTGAAFGRTGWFIHLSVSAITAPGWPANSTAVSERGRRILRLPGRNRAAHQAKSGRYGLHRIAPSSRPPPGASSSALLSQFAELTWLLPRHCRRPGRRCRAAPKDHAPDGPFGGIRARSPPMVFMAAEFIADLVSARSAGFPTLPPGMGCSGSRSPAQSEGADHCAGLPAVSKVPRKTHKAGVANRQPFLAAPLTLTMAPDMTSYC